ncbi:Flp family type IVb pilin [Pseudomonas sp.]|uniref:Flp family type IVb pilin n=1 Tax=Pseudomonas sp. TaxID=306 RepID=UPI0026167481|nr:Flp family type IVb pilin [Pseudomonas sp.]
MFLTYLIIRIRLFLNDRSGASAIEYAIVASMVAVILVAFITPVGARVKIIFNGILTAVGGTAIP